MRFTGKHIYAQAIDDDTATTLVFLSSLDAELRKKKLAANVAGAKELGVVFAAKAKAAIAQFNGQKFIEERPRPGPMTDEKAIVGHRTIKDTAGQETERLKIQVQAKVIDGNRVVIDTIDPDTQSAFEAIAEKLEKLQAQSVPAEAPKPEADGENQETHKVSLKK